MSEVLDDIVVSKEIEWVWIRRSKSVMQSRWDLLSPLQDGRSGFIVGFAKSGPSQSAENAVGEHLRFTSGRNERRLPVGRSVRMNTRFVTCRPDTYMSDFYNYCPCSSTFVKIVSFIERQGARSQRPTNRFSATRTHQVFRLVPTTTTERTGSMAACLARTTIFHRINCTYGREPPIKRKSPRTNWLAAIVASSTDGATHHLHSKSCDLWRDTRYAAIFEMADQRFV